jgi:hypothetical protein
MSEHDEYGQTEAERKAGQRMASALVRTITGLSLVLADGDERLYMRDQVKLANAVEGLTLALIELTGEGELVNVP